MCGEVKIEDSRKNDKTDIDEKSPIIDVSVFAFDFDSDAIFLGYPRYAEHTERLHRYHLKVKILSLPALNGLESVSGRDALTHLLLKT